MSDELNPDAGYCARCGNFGSGRRQWMFHSGSLPEREFYCTGCLRRMRIYAWIGFSLLFALVASLYGTVIWLSR
jgi:hypothetical protein